MAVFKDEGIVQAAAKAADELSPRLHQWGFPATGPGTLTCEKCTSCSWMFSY
jgi:hypothetical protein